MVAPVATAVTIPDDEPTVIVAGELLVHTPPVVASESVAEKPWHTLVAPVIGAGGAFTAITCTAGHTYPGTV